MELRVSSCSADYSLFCLPYLLSHCAIRALYHVFSVVGVTHVLLISSNPF